MFGSVAVTILARLYDKVTGSTGQIEQADYLLTLGASVILQLK